MQAFSDIINSGDPTEIKLQSLDEDNDTVILAADANRNAIILHSPKNFGGTRIRPENKVIGMLGLGTQVTRVNLVSNSALANCNIVVPTDDEIAACTTTEEVEDIPAPEENSLVRFKGLAIFIPAPALRNKILAWNIRNPFELILLMRITARAFDTAHENNEIILRTAITHADDLNAWLYGVKKGLIG
jgi:hypothetical protein